MGNFVILSEVNSILNFTDSTYDDRVAFWLPYMPGRVCAICNNYFATPQAYVSGGDFTFSAAASIRTAEDSFVEDGNFVAGADIRVVGSLYNDGFYTLSAVTTVLCTIDINTTYAEPKVVAENVETEDLLDVFINLVMFPRELKPIVANMIRYDMIERPTRSGAAAEKVGNYSISYVTAAGLGMNYPDDVIGGLDQFTIPVGY